jgi:hypothetical protein
MSIYLISVCPIRHLTFSLSNAPILIILMGPTRSQLSPARHVDLDSHTSGAHPPGQYVDDLNSHHSSYLEQSAVDLNSQQSASVSTCSAICWLHLPSTEGTSRQWG